MHCLSGGKGVKGGGGMGNTRQLTCVPRFGAKLLLLLNLKRARVKTRARRRAEMGESSRRS